MIATLGRMDELRKDGTLEALLRSGSKFCETMMVLSGHRRGESVEVQTRRIGPGLVVERPMGKSPTYSMSVAYVPS